MVGVVAHAAPAADAMAHRGRAAAGPDPAARQNESVAHVPTLDSSFQARTGLRYVGGFFALGLGLSALYAATGLGVACPFRLATGWDCPLCGGTRMGGALLRGDLSAAFDFNPLALVLVAALGLVGVAWLVEVLGGPALRLPATIRARLRLSPSRWLVLGLLLATAYTLLRNLL